MMRRELCTNPDCEGGWCGGVMTYKCDVCNGTGWMPGSAPEICEFCLENEAVGAFDDFGEFMLLCDTCRASGGSEYTKTED